MTSANIVFPLKRLIKLLKEFCKETHITPVEFIEAKLNDTNTEGDLDLQYLSKKFVCLTKHEKFFHVTVENFWRCENLKPFNKEILIVLMYVIIFELNENTFSSIQDSFINFNFKHTKNLVAYFMCEDNLVYVTQAGCKVFENQHVLQKIVCPLIEKLYLLEELKLHLERNAEKSRICYKKPLTKPRGPLCLSRQEARLVEEPIAENPDVFILHAQEVPLTTYTGDEELYKNLQISQENNRENAQKLLKLAQEKAFRCARVAKKQSQPADMPLVSRFKHKKPPKFRNVNIKTNTASLLRDAAILEKEQEKEVKKLEELFNGGFDISVIDELEKEASREKEKEHIQDIEKKHLQGQISYEEAVLAKRKLLKANQAKIVEFNEERQNFLQDLDIWKQGEWEKIKALVEKSQNIAKSAKEAEKQLQERRRTYARSVEDETKQLLQNAAAEREKHLERKVCLIHELRALQKVRNIHMKEFDPTDSPNFGFLCEMSIAELQERLGLLKIELGEALVQRRGIVMRNRDRQKTLIENVKKFVGQTRMSKPKPLPSATVELEQTPDIVSLKQRLLDARRMRMNVT